MSTGADASTGPAYSWLAKYPADLDWSSPILERAVDKILDEAVASFPDQPCIDFLGKVTSYREMGDLVARAAKGFQALGVRKGTRVGLCLPNCPYYLIAYYGVLKAGGIVVNFNPLYAPRELAHQINDSQTEIMVTLDLKDIFAKVESMFVETGLGKIVVCSMTAALPGLKALLFRLFKGGSLVRVKADKRRVMFDTLLANDGKPEPVAISPHKDVAVLQYTGGTTGVPKAAMLTHANVSANAHQSMMWFHGIRLGEERIVAVLPFFHVFAMTVALNLGIQSGATIVALPRFELKQLLETLQKHRITLFPGVPTLFTAINTSDQTPRFDLSSIKFCISGGAPLPMEVKRGFEEITGCILVEGYGLTEASPVTHCNPLVGTNKAGSIGLPLPGTITEIRSLEDRSRVMPTGERGELCISGPQVMAGYWNRPDETAEQIVDGWLHTGDVGYMDEDGYVFLVDRIKDLIISSGYNIYPRNIEEAIYLHPAVAEAVVVGVPDAYRGQAVKAFVALRAGATLTPEDLKIFLKDKLSPMEAPRSIEFRATLPKTMIGKLSKKELVAEELAKHQAATGAGHDRGPDKKETHA